MYLYLIKMSHSIHMFRIQIDTFKDLELVSQHQMNNLKLSFFASILYA